MKIVINACYGGFSLSEEAVNALGLRNSHDYVARNDEKLIELIESGVNCSGRFAKLEVVEIPDEATDWEISEYDGSEEVICVVDGTIYHIV